MADENEQSETHTPGEAREGVVYNVLTQTWNVAMPYVIETVNCRHAQNDGQTPHDKVRGKLEVAVEGDFDLLIEDVPQH